MSYPSGINSLVTRSTNDVAPASDHNGVKTALEEVRDVLGVNPQGSESSVQNRLNAIEALFGSNLAVNGNFDIDQRNVGSLTGINTDQYLADMFELIYSGSAVFDYEQSSTVPNDKSQNSFKLTVTTADASLAASDRYHINTRIEGFNYAPYHNNQELTISFFVRSSLTGTYSVGLANNALNRAYTTEFTINTADTFEFKTVTFRTDTTGTWEFGKNAGLEIYIVLAAGSDFTTSTTDTWQGTNDFASTNQVNWAATLNNEFYLSQFKIESGNDASEFVPVDRALTLLRAMRYYEKSFEYSDAPGATTAVSGETGRASSTSHIHNVRFKVPKRTTPSLTAWNYVTGASGSWRDTSAGADRTITFVSSGETGASAEIASTVDGNAYNGHWEADADF